MMASPQQQNYWNWPQSSSGDSELKMNNLHLMPTGSPLLRRRDEDGSSSPGQNPLGLRMKPKMKKHTAIPGSPVSSPRTQKRIEEDKLAKRIRESYACLRHRAMHKRCPAECPERRIPKPLPVAQERKQVQQQQQLQQQIHQAAKMGKLNDSPLLNGSPNTLRVIQAFQNARISSPGVLRHSANGLTEVKSEYVNSNFNPHLLGNPCDSPGSSSSWESNSWDPSDMSSTVWGTMNGNPEHQIDSKDWADSAISSNWDAKSSSDDDISPNHNRDIDYWLDNNNTNNPQNDSGNLWNDPIGALTIDLGSSLDPHNVQLFGEISQQSMHQMPPMSSSHNHINSHPQPTSSIENLFKILLTRDTLERWMWNEWFNKSLRGFYIRVRIAEVNNVEIFKIGCIVEARDHCFETYRVGDKETQKGLVVHFGSSGQHLVSMASPSNEPPNDQECEEWIEDAERNSISITQREVDEKIAVAAMLNTNQSPPYSSH